MSRSLYVTSLTVRKARKKTDNPRRVVSRLPDHDSGKVGGGDLLTYIEEVIQALDADALTDQQNHHYARVVSASRAHGHPRVLLVELDVGRYGEAGNDIDTDTHAVTHKRAAKEASASRARVAFVVPEGSDAAMMFAENVNRSSARGRIVGAIKDAWKSDGYAAGWTLRCESVVEQDIWLEAADLSKVTAVEYNHSTDWDADGTGKVIGDMTYTLEPTKTSGKLKKTILEALRSGDITKAKALGIEVSDDTDLDEVRVTMTDGEATKTFVIDREKTPSIRIPLGDLEGDPAQPNNFVSKCLKECPRVYQAVGATWHSV